jgi:nifR3 family TIM-barrel protein
MNIKEGFSIADLKMQNCLVLAPMAAISDLPFRLLCRKQGAALCYTEMINAEAVARNNKSSFKLAKSHPDDQPLGLQLFGAKVESMKTAAKKLAETEQFDFFDLNLGCPDGRVLRQGAGAALLRREQRACELVKAIKEAGKPVTVKVRLNPNVLNSIRLCKALEKAGAECITVHGRTVKQKYSGPVDFVSIKRIAKAVSVPVIANGNIRSRKDVKITMEKTGAAAVMIGRGAIGNPGIFADLQGHLPIKPINAMFNYLKLFEEFGMDKFGRKKTQVIRFLVKAKKQQAVELVQKAGTEEELEQALADVK